MRRLALFILLLPAVFSLTGISYAEQTLTITLDPTQEQKQKETQNDLRLKHETLGATRTEAEKKYQTQVRSTGASSRKEVAIGRVGIVSASKASIRSYPSSRGTTLFVCPKDTPLAVLGQNGSWYGVLMVDSSTGWVEKSKVSLLDYQVTSNPSQSGGVGSRVINTALRYLGIPYRWGGYSAGGIDCSGFVKAVFASHGVSLPRVARDQARVGIPVGWSELQAGDRLYFACKGGAVDHAGIYMGNGLFIHSSIGRGGVAVDKITKPFFANSLVAARRS